MSNNSYKSALKSTSIFGGVQIINILLQILKTKIAAILIGATGMGVLGLFTQAISFISMATNFGLETSAIKNISVSAANNDSRHLFNVKAALQRLVYFTGALGFLICFLFAKQLSQIVFNNTTYTTSFRILSVTLLFMQLTVGQNVILQGLRKIRELAFANVLGTLSGLLISAVCYYFWKIEGIVPSIILSAFLLFLITFFFSQKISFDKFNCDKRTMISESKQMLKMGFLLSLSAFIATGCSFILRIIINRTGSIEDVGFYNAGFAIIEGYVGIIFGAMAKDYFPRLSIVSHNIEARNREINQQSEIALIFLVPIICIFLLFIDYLVVILYSKEFLSIIQMLKFAILGVLFRAASWSLGYLLLAKGDSKVFFWSELLSSTYVLGLNILGYKLMGITGIGISFIAVYLIHFIQMYVTCKILYKYNFNGNILKLFILSVIIVSAQFAIIEFTGGYVRFLLGSVVIIAACALAYRELDKRINIGNIFKEKILKKLKK